VLLTRDGPRELSRRVDRQRRRQRPARVGRRQGADAAAIEREVEQPLQRYCGPRSGGAVDDGRIVALAL
jgi:hypothetical protein